MKTVALDVGDVWVGIAISDPLGITCRPHTTVTLDELESSLAELLRDERIGTIVVGHPLTMKGTESEQTKKIVKIKNKLEEKFEDQRWVLWDERLSSKRASATQGSGRKSKDEKLHEHAIAASYILQSYLDALAFASEEEE